MVYSDPQIIASFTFTPHERRIFARKEPLKPSQWAEKYRVVAMGAHRGAWRNSISPHLVEIMDTFALPYVREVVICKAPQTGGTEVLMNCAAYAMERDPSPMMLVMPSEKTGKKTMTDRIIPMIEQSASLQALISPNQDDLSKTRIKLANGTILYIAWANSATALASFPIKHLLFDEIDKFPASIGKETSSIALGEKRVTTYPHTYKIFKVSTPTSEDGAIWRAMNSADVLYKYHVCCPDCRQYHIMSVDGLKWQEDSDKVWYECPHCLAVWSNTRKKQAVKNGHWVADGSNNKTRPQSFAYHLPAWVSPDISLKQIHQAFIAAKTDKIKLIDFYNAYLAEPYIATVDGEQANEDAMYDRRYNYSPEGAGWSIPMGACVLTCAVDVQQSPPRLEAEVVAWGLGYESWGVDYMVFAGDPAKEQVWEALDEYLQRERVHESGDRMRISACAIDAGYLAPHVYRFVRKRAARRVYAVKGSNTRGRALITHSASTRKKGKVNLFIVGTETAKDVLYNWMQLTDHGAGYMHYHTGYAYSYFRQLTAEVGVTEYDKGGRPYRVWKKKSNEARTEALDIRVYNLAALEILNPDMKLLAKQVIKKASAIAAKKSDDGQAVKEQDMPPQLPNDIVTTQPQQQPARRPFAYTRRAGGWLRNY